LPLRAIPGAGNFLFYLKGGANIQKPAHQLAMYKDTSEKHNKPHIHVKYAEKETVIVLDGEIPGGQIPKSEVKLVEAWMEIHHKGPKANWKLLYCFMGRQKFANSRNNRQKSRRGRRPRCRGTELFFLIKGCPGGRNPGIFLCCG
jgi:hypothetical protein